jgi:2'-5' RNA ligase
MFADPIAGRDRINSYALVSYIPDPMAGFLDRLRQELVPNCFLRAHGTILPPRPITSSPREAWDRLCFEATRFEPFDVELTGVEVFPVSDVIHVAIGNGTDQLRTMHAAMNVGGLKFTELYPYHPHVTLAQNLKPDELDELIRVARQRWKEHGHPRSFRVEALTFVQSTRWKEWIDLGEYRLGLEGNEAFAAERIDDSSLWR